MSTSARQKNHRYYTPLAHPHACYCQHATFRLANSASATNIPKDDIFPTFSTQNSICRCEKYVAGTLAITVIEALSAKTCKATYLI